jgi:hypothetical protein
MRSISTTRPVDCRPPCAILAGCCHSLDLIPWCTNAARLDASLELRVASRTAAALVLLISTKHCRHSTSTLFKHHILWSQGGALPPKAGVVDRRVYMAHAGYTLACSETLGFVKRSYFTRILYHVESLQDCHVARGGAGSPSLAPTQVVAPNLMGLGEMPCCWQVSPAHGDLVACTFHPRPRAQGVGVAARSW